MLFLTFKSRYRPQFTINISQKHVSPYIVCIEPENLGGGGLSPQSPPGVYTLATESCRKCAEFTIHQESFSKFDYPVYCISSSFPLSEI